MQETNLTVQLREEKGAQGVTKVRAANFIPGVVYGGERDSTLVKVDKGAYLQIMRQHHGETVLFHLNVFQGDKKLRDYSAIVKDEQLDPVSEDILHIDFLRIKLDEKIEVQVPIEAKGEPIGVRKEGGSLDHHLWEMTVTCLPINIPAHIDVDVSELKIGDAVHVKDITLPQGVETEHEPDEIVLSVVPPSEEPEEPSEEEGEAEPEVIGKGKEAEEGEEEEGEEEGKTEEKKGEEKGEEKEKPEKSGEKDKE